MGVHASNIRLQLLQDCHTFTLPECACCARARGWVQGFRGGGPAMRSTEARRMGGGQGCHCIYTTKDACHCRERS